jgi:hypothetical protein
MSTVDSTGEDVTGDPSSTGSEGSESSSSDSGPVVVCSDLDCEDCVFDCVVQDDQVCGDAYDVCAGTPDCPGIAACMANCGASGLCLDNCCEDKGPAAITAAHAVDDCRSDACALACGDYPTASCVGT